MPGGLSGGEVDGPDNHACTSAVTRQVECVGLKGGPPCKSRWLPAKAKRLMLMIVIHS